MKLPMSCDVEYLESFVSKAESTELFEWFYANCDIQKLEEILMADGTNHPVRPWKIMFVDQELEDYAIFSEVHGRNRMKWPPLIEVIRDRIEQLTGVEFSVCVCLYYPNGEEGIGFHSDPPAFGPTTPLPSISVGEP
ncbi:alpha-ketoglutarate-dependent dioxygenase AlkB [Marinobacterium arenosum]|uniref:alpha-ketoglutarate-dependent dioxygenase AlkB n=1 Tax=Marinobacterium arenosum TaxID=2862496 RepID=UPI001C93F285|nr:alpha-ketoglutarate-dependent dioxygenase AlkB [Marinobacterium arenosum]MBY4677673.1 hypothetical protein [Marinobacterium arenosum]